MTVEILTTGYRFFHRHDPRGLGPWEFAIDGGEAFRIPHLPYAEARKLAVALAKELARDQHKDVVRVIVLP